MAAKKLQIAWGFPLLLAVCLINTPAQAKYNGGSGTAGDPYRIAAVEDLMLLGNSPEDYSKHFILTGNIDLDPGLPGRKVFDKAVIAPDTGNPDWVFQGTPFTGVFDGNGQMISHLTIKGGEYLGLFGRLASGAEVRDLGVQTVSITASGNRIYIGGLVGSNGGTVIRCYSTGAVSGSQSVGGLVGINEWGHVIQCYSTAAVSGRGEGIGGLVGSNGDWRSGGVVTQSYSTGPVSGGFIVGGLVGANEGDVTYCYSTGAVSGNGDVGGLVGANFDFQFVVTYCFWDTQTSGQTTSAGGTGKTTAQMQRVSTFLNAGWDFVDETVNGTDDIWWIDEGKDYPRLWWDSHVPGPSRWEGSGTADDPYQIATADDLMLLGSSPEDYDKHFFVTADIDLDPNLPGRKVFNSAVIAPDTNQTRNWFQGTPFNGVFDGNSHSISHLTINGGGSLGLFGQLAAGALVKNLGLTGVNVTGSSYDVGGIVGSNGSWGTDGVMTGDTQGGTVTRCHSTGVVSGRNNVGGLIGSNYGRVTRCYSTVTASGNGTVGGLVGYNNSGTLIECYSAGAASASGWYVGGLVGSNGALWGKARIIQCYSNAAATGTQYAGGLVGRNSERSSVWGTISNCYSTGRVSGTSPFGGLVGGDPVNGWDDDIKGCFWDTQTSGQTTSSGGTGKTTTQMQTVSTFLDAGWDFVDETANGTEDIWWIDEGKDYPRLRWGLTDTHPPEPPAEGNVIELTEATFDQIVLGSDIPVLVDFWAPWCQPCLIMAPIIEEIAKEYAGRVKVCKLDTDTAPNICRRYNIQYIPTFILFKDAQIQKRWVGVTPKEDLVAGIEALL